MDNVHYNLIVKVMFHGIWLTIFICWLLSNPFEYYKHNQEILWNYWFFIVKVFQFHLKPLLFILNIFQFSSYIFSYRR